MFIPSSFVLIIGGLSFIPLLDKIKLMSVRRKVLILDPEPFIQELLKIKLEAEGLQVIIAENEREAKKALLLKPELLILDILHPKLNAYKFVQSLKSHPKLAKTKVIILTFKKKDPETFFLYNVWTEAYFEKPFVPDQLVSKLRSILKPERTKDG